MKLKKDYRIAETALDHIKPNDRHWVVIEDLWKVYAACPETQMAAFLRRLTPGQRAFLALHGLEAEVLNGGMHQYLWNSTGNLFSEALEGSALIGAKDLHRLLCKVADLFPDPGLLRNRRRRQKAVDKMRPATTEKLFDDPFEDLEARRRTRLSTLRTAYLKRHPQEFILPAGQVEESLLPEPGSRDYRVPRAKAARLRGERLHWALIEKLWDDYWEPLKASKSAILEFIPTLTPGQRALIAIDILNKVVLRLNGFGHFLGTQVGSDVLATEVGRGYELLGAKPYAELFARVLAAAGDLTDLARKVSEQSAGLQAAKKSGDAARADAARRAWRAAFDQLQRRTAEVADSLERFDTELKALLGSSDRKIERYIEAYFDAHPEEFVR